MLGTTGGGSWKVVRGLNWRCPDGFGRGGSSINVYRRTAALGRFHAVHILHGDRGLRQGRNTLRTEHDVLRIALLLLLRVDDAHIEVLLHNLVLVLGGFRRGGVDRGRIPYDYVRPGNAIVVHVVVVAGHDRGGEGNRFRVISCRRLRRS